MMTNSFLVALALTVLALGGVLWSGITHRRQTHYALIAAMFAALGWAIWEAERIGAHLRFDGAAGVFHKIHFAAVAIDAVLVPLLIVSGVRLARLGTAEHRASHGKLAKIFVTMVVVTCALGTAMTVTAHPIDDSPAASEASGG
ncbi:MAG: hypothetical protein H6825_07660 [Planctomycetes bacterium]|nr:hypothetical protein [Planctomycetota bacterium]